MALRTHEESGMANATPAIPVLPPLNIYISTLFLVQLCSSVVFLLREYIFAYARIHKNSEVVLIVCAPAT